MNHSKLSQSSERLNVMEKIIKFLFLVHVRADSLVNHECSNSCQQQL